eukprot:NODE_13866_length_238_cov_23.530055.p1 GENE.NODE_13866_length_238_cov_23.530055~~NODE_13866_length_238_cov_23.530055.p1  ORF type:complete len:62 (-),score=35.12 NODE_13866_length_238_cov_23.530055:37-222(-)
MGPSGMLPASSALSWVVVSSRGSHLSLALSLLRQENDVVASGPLKDEKKKKKKKKKIPPSF